MIYAATFLILITLTAAMAVGVMFKRPPLKGSCGGVGGDCACDAEGRPRECEKTDAPREAPMASLPGRGQAGHSKHLRSGALPE